MSELKQCFEILCIQCQESMRDCFCKNELYICGIHNPILPYNIEYYNKKEYGLYKLRGATTILIVNKYNLNFLKVFNFVLWETKYDNQKYMYIMEYPNAGIKQNLGIFQNLNVITGKMFDLILSNTLISRFGEYTFVINKDEYYLLKDNMILISDDFGGATLDFCELRSP